MTAKELRELDAWIAEHVMGWLFNRHGIPFSPHPNDKWQAETVVPFYTTDPAAAMMVLEKCTLEVERLGNELGFDIDLSVGRLNGEFALSHCVTKETITAETLPLAICLFAKQLFHAQEKETKVH